MTTIIEKIALFKTPYGFNTTCTKLSAPDNYKRLTEWKEIQLVSLPVNKNTEKQINVLDESISTLVKKQHQLERLKSELITSIS